MKFACLSEQIGHVTRLARVIDRQQGAALLVSLVMMIVVLMVGVSAAQIALQGEKASRNDRDRQIAFQAAEAALMDAELDIEGAPATGNARSHPRSHLFAPDKLEGFAEGCGSGVGNIYLGLCTRAEEGADPVWLTADFTDDTDDARSVPYGQFTGQSFQTGKGSLPGRVPRYIIELMLFNREGEGATREDVTYFYRVTAIGFGARESTQVVLQTFYRKDGR